MKPVKIVSILAALLLVVVLAAWFALGRYLGSEAFKQAVLQKTAAAVGVPVYVKTFHFSIWKGLQLTDLSVGSPSGFQKELLSAQSVDFRYRLLSLLQGRVEIDKAVLDHPKIIIEQRSDGQTNLPPVGVSPTGTAPAGGTSLDIDIKEFGIVEGEASGRKADGSSSFTVTGLNLTSAIQLIGDKITLQGKLSTRTFAFTPLLLENLGSPFVLENNVLKLSDISAAAFGGRFQGTGSLDTKARDLPFTLDLKGSGLQLTRLAEQLAGKKSPLSGQLELNTTLVAPLTDPALVQGKGRLEVKDASLGENAVLQLLGEVLHIKELRGGKFDLAVTDFTIANKMVSLSNLVLTGPLVNVRGGGNIGFNQNYDLQLVLNLKSSAAAQIPGEIKASFIANPDGSLSSPPFRVYGSSGNLQQTLLQELLQQRAKSEIQKRAGGLLDKLFK